jgi:UDP-N-acetylglucosamine 1-carboxyvinyltransferase
MINKNITLTTNNRICPNGEVRVSGAKNSATPLLAAALISDDKVKLLNFPTKLVDAQYKIKFIKECNGEVVVNDEEDYIIIDSKNLGFKELIDYYYPIRTTYLLVAGLLKRSGIARIPYPGGCNIGNRGYDLHMMVWEKLGAIVEEKENYIEVRMQNNKLHPAEIDFPISTIGGTENALITASIIEGTTKIRNAYISPEVEDLIEFLKAIGVEIKVIGRSYIEVSGKKTLRGDIYTVMPDRIEALTWLVYGALSGGSITIRDVPFHSMEIPLIHIEKMGIDYYQNSNNIYISPDSMVNGAIQPFEVASGTHPGIISDMQPFYTLLGLHANGTSRIFDYRYPERLKYCAELNKFYGNRIEWESGKITIHGNNNKPVNAIADSTDLRGSMAVIIAALLAEGESKIFNAELALRGYNDLPNKLAKLGIEVLLEESNLQG